MDTDEVEEWAPDASVSWLTNAKLLAMKICRNRCIAHGGSDSALDLANPVLTMFLTLLAHGGSMTEEARDECVLFSTPSWSHPNTTPLAPKLSPECVSWQQHLWSSWLPYLLIVRL